jgi:solute carrier organic anion transporter family, member 4A
VPYAGIFYTTAIIGPAIGYILGGQLLEIYCDIGAVDMTTYVYLVSQ